MQQLLLPVRLADHAVFGNFLAAGNELPVHQLQLAAAGGAGPLLWLWGPAESGRTHLLQAAVAAAGDLGRRAAYLPLRGGEGSPALAAGALDGMGDLDLVALDDIDAVAGDAVFEQAVFGLFEQLRAQGGRLLASAGAPPADVPVRLPDLASRLASGGAYRLQALDDDGRLEALRIRARFRGFELPDDTGRYLLKRLARGPASLFRLLDTLDDASLVAQKRLTIPFVRAVLDPAGRGRS